MVYRVSFGYDWDVVGIEIGTLGLLSGPIAARPLGPSDLDSRLNRESGTFLGSTNKGNPFVSKMPDGSVRNRFMAASIGSRAFNLLAEGQRYRMAAWRDRQVIDVRFRTRARIIAALMSMGCLLRRNVGSASIWEIRDARCRGGVLEIFAKVL